MERECLSMNKVIIFINPKALHPKKKEVFFRPHDIRKYIKLNTNAYCNMCLKKGVIYTCASIDHDRIHSPIGGFHLCQECFDRMYLKNLVVADVVHKASMPSAPPLPDTSE